MNQMKFYFTEEEKFQHRLSLSYEERYRAAMRMIRLVHKLKQATIVKPSESDDVNYLEDLKKIIAEEAKKNPNQH
ncbi:MAG: hypothetical protein SGJ00_08970 [bacterium]|nr:hypothetical protein [bacterium]